jgi:hypothetical protein
VNQRLKDALMRSGLRAPARALSAWVRNPASFKTDWDVRADYRRFRRSYRSLAADSAAPAFNGQLLVVNMTDFVAQTKTEAVFARAIEACGLKPVIVTYTGSRAVRYDRAFGIEMFLYFDRYVAEAEAVGAEDEIDKLMGTDVRFADVKDFEYQGIGVGRQALATLLRQTHQGRLDFDDPATRESLRRLLFSGARASVAAKRLLDDVKPALVLVNDAMYVGVGALFEEAIRREIPVVQWVGTQRDDAFVFKRFDAHTMKEHPFSVSPETWERVAAEPWTEKRDAELAHDFAERYVEGRWESFYNRRFGEVVGADAVRLKLGLDPGRRTAVIFSHILWDSTLFWGEDLFDDYEDWLIETVRAAAANPRLDWIVKFHPANTWKLRRDRQEDTPSEAYVLASRLGELPQHVRLLPSETDISAFDLFGVADIALTVRGTVGIEAAALGVPVVTAGTGRYSGLGFTVDSGSRQEYLRRLATLEELPPLDARQTELAKKYAHTLFLRRPTVFDSFQWVYRPISQVGHPLDHNVEIHPRRLDEIRSAEDLTAFAEWAVHSSDRDFLSNDSARHAETT